MTLAPDLAEMALADLRSRRSLARRQWEVARMRARGDDAAETGQVARLHDLVAALTEELISRYAADLTLVDSLLDGAYAQGGPPDKAPTSGGDR